MHSIRRTSLVLASLCILLFSYPLRAQEYYIRFVEKSRDIRDTKVTQTVSIDELRNDTIYAYANSNELLRLQQLGYSPEHLPHPSAGAKNIVMATSVEQMAGWDRYPTYEVYRDMMKSFQSTYPDLCELDSIGVTTMGRQLYVLRISGGSLQDGNKPEVFLTSTMHGDETTGFVLLLRLADYLLSNYGEIRKVTQLLNSMAIYINPNANPDGTYRNDNQTIANPTRGNANYIDINRNFPDPRAGNNPDGDEHQPETIAMMNFASERNFTLSANLHGGIELANFPWDTWRSSQRKHPDHNWFYHISRQYATSAQVNSPDGYFTARDNGVTHGGDWYVITGGRQDYMNYWHSCREITLEVSNSKLLSSDLLPAHWQYNRDALLAYIVNALYGIKGRVTDSDGTPIAATITVEGHDSDNSHVVSHTETGHYIRMIELGSWNITYSAEGFTSQTHTVVVDDWYTTTEKNVVLCSADRANLTVNVFDALTGLPIHNATVELPTIPASSGDTNSSGQHLFICIPQGTHTLRASRGGYASLSREVVVNSSNPSISVLLSPSIPEVFLDSIIPLGLIADSNRWKLDSSASFAGHQSLMGLLSPGNPPTTLSLSLDIVHDGDISFVLKSETNDDNACLSFHVNGQEVEEWCGSSPWTEFSYPLSQGLNAISWELKGESGHEAKVWIDSIVLPLSLHNATFLVQTASGEPIPNAVITFNSMVDSTDTTGIVCFVDIPRGISYPYLVTKEDYTPASGHTNIHYQDASIPIVLNHGGYFFDVKFNVLANGIPYQGALVALGDSLQHTNQEGEVEFSRVEAGPYTQTISAVGFQTDSSLLLLASDTTIVIHLLEPIQRYSITVRVTDSQGNPILGAEVELNGATKNTDAWGEVEFHGVPSGNQTIQASSNQYNSTSTTINLTDDFLLEVTLTGLAAPQYTQHESTLRIWPNPTEGIINIELWLPDRGAIQANLYKASGEHIQELIKGEALRRTNSYSWQSELSNLPAGVYIIRVVTPSQVYSGRIIVL